MKTKLFVMTMSHMTGKQSYTTPKADCFTNLVSIVNPCQQVFANQIFFLKKNYVSAVGHLDSFLTSMGRYSPLLPSSGHKAVKFLLCL